jgi:hypothetical protein
MSSGPSPTRFTTAVTALALVGCLCVIVAPVVFNTTAAFRGSVVGSAVVGAVFAGYNLYTVRAYGQPRLAAGLMTAVFGGWFIAAPLVYPVGDVPTAIVQTCGMLTAAFGGYAAVEAVELLARGTPLAEDVPQPGED